MYLDCFHQTQLLINDGRIHGPNYGKILVRLAIYTNTHNVLLTTMIERFSPTQPIHPKQRAATVDNKHQKSRLI